jgi:arylsulfatase A-like enzyme/tetratricopeptide (TPR) repeat protein
LLIVTMDTTRADRLGAYGYAGAQTPAIDAVAAQGLRFDRAYATVPLTTPAHASMFTGLYPTRHGLHTNGDATLSDEHTTLAEVLRGQGYHTVGSISAFVTTRIWNLDQGFDTYFDAVEASEGARDSRWGRERRAEEVVFDLMGWFEEKPDSEPFFAWAHFYDPHDPYSPPAPYDKALKGRPYDGEIAYMDAQLARLVAAAEAEAGPRGLAVILVADHGEALRSEHGETTHGMYTFDPTMRIPFIVRPPGGMAAPRSVDAVTVSNVDVTPTALGLLGLPVPEDLDGADLSGFTRGEDRERAPVFLEAETVYTRFGFHPEWAAAQGPWKLMATPNPRLFQVDDDPEETVNRLADEPQRVAALQAFVDGVQDRRVSVEALAASPEVVEQLAALGYVAGADVAPMDVTGLPDAKDQQDVVSTVERARRLARAPGKSKEAAAALGQILRDHPMMSEVRQMLSQVLQRRGKLAEAEAVLAKGVELNPQGTILRSHLASVIARQGRLEEAFELSQTIYEQVPGDDLARYSMLQYLADMGRVDEGLALGSRWLEAEPENRGLQALVGVLWMRKGQLAKAEPLLLASLLDSQPRQLVHRSLGMIAAAVGDLEGLVSHLQQESAWFPRNLRVRWELGNAMMSQKRWDEAAAEYAGLVRLAPRDIQARRAWAQAVFNGGDYAAAAAILDPALAAAPDDPQVLLLQANLLDKQGKTEEALEVAAQAKALYAASEQVKREEAAPLFVEPTESDDLPGLDELQR